MADKKEMTTLNASVGADAGQSSKVFDEHIIPHDTVKFNDEFSDYEEKSANIDQIIQRMNDPSFMPVVSIIDTIHGAEASAVIYSLVETAKANNLKIYEYLKHLLTEIPKHMDDTSMDFLEDLLPWSEKLPEECHKKI